MLLFRRLSYLFFLSLLFCLGLEAQNQNTYRNKSFSSSESLNSTVIERLQTFFNEYETTYAKIGKCSLKRIEVDHDNRVLQIYSSPSFGYQPFTEPNTQAIYRSIRQILPGPVNYYNIQLFADGKLIEDLIPNAFRSDKDKSRLYKKNYKGNAWVTNQSLPYQISNGLQGRHIALWQSHGNYYKKEKNAWVWQRPRLFTTTEDLFTQSIVVPYLIPMLEHAGAYVFTPRERDWQRNEVVIDNDRPHVNGHYLDKNYRKYKWNTYAPGFAHKQSTYTDNQNPFHDGTVRFIRTQKKPQKAFAEWIPNIPEKGKYAVYVSYQTQKESIDDAKYTVFHNGGATEFTVNQRMGGGTWVYLGTFEFDKGINDYGMVVLSNESSQKGVVCADAVRFGGGMGNIEREGKTSGLPRYLEGARYWAQWAGMPYSVYSKSEGKNDYNDDINTRSLMTNYLSGGSIFNPTEKGLNVPFELSFALHSDAGFDKDNQLVGSLGIYTTNYNEGKLNSGVSRYASRDLADMVLTGLQKDIQSSYGIQWARRGMWNRNYSETRLPAIPSMILEILSHQNFTDLRLGYDPTFKFTIGRSIYKSILKYLAEMHHTEYKVQPLPVSHFAIKQGEDKNTFVLNWHPESDPTEPSATPEGYILYTRIGHGGFDNGTFVKKPQYTVNVEPGIVYSFKVAAVNKGGESFPSETLSAYKAKRSKGNILIVNAFNKTCGPATIQSALTQGFDLAAHPGIPYINTHAHCGYQLNFNRRNEGIESEEGLGYSNDQLEGILIAGNTFDYPFLHGKAIQAADRYSFVSCSNEALETGRIKLEQFDMIDIICGEDDAVFSEQFRSKIENYCNQGGKLFISGSYLGRKSKGNNWDSLVLKFKDGGNMPPQSAREVFGTQITIQLPSTANEKTFAVPAPGCLLPVENGYTSFVYTAGNYSAGTVYNGNYRTFALGFPFESIQDVNQRTHIMKAVLNFLLKK